MDQQWLEQAARHAGIGDNYISAWGTPATISLDTKAKLLAAMGRHEYQPEPAETVLPPVTVVHAGDAVHIAPALPPGSRAGEFSWRLTQEDGQRLDGDLSEGVIVLPATLAQGYHRLELRRKRRKTPWLMTLIIAPRRCFEAEAIRRGHKLWGSSVQLYTLKSEQNWGIGDFADLARLVTELAGRGAAFVGLNPIHALYPAHPESASPYSPSSRRWLNIIYIAVPQVPEFGTCPAARAWLDSPGIQQRLAVLRATDWVDYSAVTALKLEGLKLAYEAFSTLPENHERVREFETFRLAGGDSLAQQAAFDALHEHLKTHDAHAWGWSAWPEPYRRWQAPAVAAFCTEHDGLVRFYAWLQWLASDQLARCQQAAKAGGMALGLYRDLAVGVSEGSAETWADSELYCLNASVGAPPDVLGPFGQNWSLPPMNPRVLRERGYQPFIEMLRANMTACGALRIDHVLGLMRLWWIPRGEGAEAGAYVHYPVDDLLAILALESQRHRCQIIGEALGTVPDDIVARLEQAGIYSYKVFYFERSREDGGYLSPAHYPVQAMATLSTHDLPTVRGFWLCDDLRLGRELGLYHDEALLRAHYDDRHRAKQRILDSLHGHGVLPDSVSRDVGFVGMSEALSHGLQLHVAGTRSALLALQPEDWLDMEQPVNIPGTSDQYPNWRRRLSATLAELFARDDVNRLLEGVNLRRQRLSERRQGDV